MKFTVDINTLRDLSVPVEAATLPKSNVPDYAHILVVVHSNDTMDLVGGNGKFTACVAGIAVRDAQEGRALVPAGIWQQIMRQSSGSSITFESDAISYANIVTADNGTRQEFNIHVLPADDYESMPFTSEVISFGVDRFMFGEALSMVKPTVDSDNTFEIVNGICLEINTTHLNIVATNIATLGFARLPAIFEAVGDKLVSSAPSATIARVMPRDAIDLVERALAKFQGDLVIRLSDSVARFEVGSVCITTSLLAGGTEYINWQRNVPDAIDGPTLTGNAGVFVDAVRDAEIVNAGEPIAVDFSTSGGELTVSASGVGGTYSEKITVDSVYGSVDFRLDSRLVRTALRSVESGTKLQIATVNDGSRIQVVPTLPTLKNDAFQIWAVLTRKREG